MSIQGAAAAPHAAPGPHARCAPSVSKAVLDENCKAADILISGAAGKYCHGINGLYTGKYCHGINGLYTGKFCHGINGLYSKHRQILPRYQRPLLQVFFQTRTQRGGRAHRVWQALAAGDMRIMRHDGY
jgi:hypothetical protein